MKKEFNLKKNKCNKFNDNEQQTWMEMEMQISKLRFRLGAVNKPEFYQAVLDRIEMLGENDEIEVVIDSVGGDLDGCIAICDALQATEATVTGILVNRAFSAGAFIALCCDNLEVRPNARMMIHSYSGGYVGKDHELELDFMFNKQFIRKFLARCCEGFLDEKELAEMYNGKDWWFNFEDIVERLKARQLYNDEKYRDEYESCEGNCSECSCHEDISNDCSDACQCETAFDIDPCWYCKEFGDEEVNALLASVTEDKPTKRKSSKNSLTD